MSERPQMTAEQAEAVIKFLTEMEDVIEHKGKHEGHTLSQVGRCVYCSCGFRYQGRLP
jgi:hypothetical protein